MAQNSAQEHYVGMPEFTAVKVKPYAQIIVRCENEHDLQRLAILLEQKLTNKTKSIWYPFKSHFRDVQKEWVDES